MIFYHFIWCISKAFKIKSSHLLNWRIDKNKKITKFWYPNPEWKFLSLEIAKDVVLVFLPVFVEENNKESGRGGDHDEDFRRV